MSIRALFAIALFAVLPACDDLTTFVVDVPASQLSGAFTLNGQAFPAAYDEAGDIRLHGAHPGDIVSLGQTWDQGYDAFVVDGLYDARYSRASGGGAGVPMNGDARVMGPFAVDGDDNLPIEVGAATVSATFTLNGGPFPATANDSGTFYLQPVGSKERIYLGDSHQGSGSTRVVPGTYHVLYDHQSGTQSPINKSARVAEDVVVTADQHIAVDVAASYLSLEFTLDGNPFPQSEYNDANLHLRDAVTGAESWLMNTHAPVGRIFAIDGTYDVIYRHETGSGVPINTAAVVVDGYVHDNGGWIVRDITSVTVDASITLNGSPFKVSEYQDGIISLFDAQTDSDTVLGNTHAPFTGLVLIPGVYDVLYTHETGDQVPRNVRGTVSTDVVVDGSLLVADVVGIQVAAEITLDGQPFPASDYQDANFVLTGDGSGEDILVGNSHQAVLSVMVMPGTYDLHYRHESGDQVPRNNNYRVFADQVLAADTTLVADLETRRVSVAATLNGAQFPAGGQGRIYAQSAEGDAVLMLETGGAQHDSLLITGDYEFVYEYVSGAGVPVNPWASVLAVSIQ